MSTRSILSAVNAVKYAPPSGGVAKDSHEVLFAPILSVDFGEITDNAAVRRRCKRLS